MTDPTGFEAATATVTTVTGNGLTTTNQLMMLEPGQSCGSDAVCITDEDGNTWQNTSTTVTNETGKSRTTDWTGGKSDNDRKSASFASRSVACLPGPACAQAMRTALQNGLFIESTRQTNRNKILSILDEDDNLPPIGATSTPSLFPLLKKLFGSTASSPGDLPPDDGNKKQDSQDNGKCSIHHICTDKNTKSTNNGGPWTPRFKEMFDRAGMSLQDTENKVVVQNHAGPHPEQYHRYVYNYLDARTAGLEGQEYTMALRQGLRELGKELSTPGTPLNNLVTKVPK